VLKAIYRKRKLFITTSGFLAVFVGSLMSSMVEKVYRYEVADMLRKIPLEYPSGFSIGSPPPIDLNIHLQQVPTPITIFENPSLLNSEPLVQQNCAFPDSVNNFSFTDKQWPVRVRVEGGSRYDLVFITVLAKSETAAKNCRAVVSELIRKRAIEAALLLLQPGGSSVELLSGDNLIPIATLHESVEATFDPPRSLVFARWLSLFLLPAALVCFFDFSKILLSEKK
jgi:hypothetical protein